MNRRESMCVITFAAATWLKWYPYFEMSQNPSEYFRRLESSPIIPVTGNRIGELRSPGNNRKWSIFHRWGSISCSSVILDTRSLCSYDSRYLADESPSLCFIPLRPDCSQDSAERLELDTHVRQRTIRPPEDIARENVYETWNKNDLRNLYWQQKDAIERQVGLEFRTSVLVEGTSNRFLRLIVTC